RAARRRRRRGAGCARRSGTRWRGRARTWLASLRVALLGRPVVGVPLEEAEDVALAVGAVGVRDGARDLLGLLRRAAVLADALGRRGDVVDLDVEHDHARRLGVRVEAVDGARGGEAAGLSAGVAQVVVVLAVELAELPAEALPVEAERPLGLRRGNVEVDDRAGHLAPLALISGRRDASARARAPTTFGPRFSARGGAPGAR